MDESLEETVRRLADIEAIKQLKARYYRYLDLHWWDAWREVFTEDLQIAIAESSQGPSTREELVAAATEHLSGALTVHHGHMPEITILDDTHATGIWAMFDLVEPVADGFPHLTGYGHYVEEYRKEAGEWRISRLSLTRLKRTVSQTATHVDGDASTITTFVPPRGSSEGVSST